MLQNNLTILNVKFLFCY